MDAPRNRSAAAAADHLTEPEHARKYATRDDVSADVGAATREQREETEDGWVGPGVPVMTQAQTKGLAVGIVVGGAIGALLFLPVTLIPMGELAAGWRLLIVAIVGALAGGTIGVVYLGGRMPELEGETVDAEGRPDMGTPRVIPAPISEADGPPSGERGAGAEVSGDVPEGRCAGVG
jgi:hypothetical protein